MNVNAVKLSAMARLHVIAAVTSNWNAYMHPIAAVAVSEIPSEPSLKQMNKKGIADSKLRDFRAMNASILSLQGQVDDLYGHLNALRRGQEQVGVLHHDTDQYSSHPLLEHGSSQNVFHQWKSSPRQRARRSQFQGPTSSTFSFEVANSSLQTMGLTQSESLEQNGGVYNGGSPDTSYHNQAQAPTAPMVIHPDKDPLWSISKDEAVRLCRLYQEEMGVMYPIVNIEDVIERAKLLFTFTEAATRIGFISTQMPGPDELGTDDNNILKMVLATASTVEGNGHSEMGQRLFHSVRDTSRSLWEPVELKGLTLIVIIVCKRCQTLECDAVADQL